MKAILFAVAAGLCWGVGEVCTKQVLHSGKVGPFTALAVRASVALPAIWLAWWLAVSRTGEPTAWWRADGGTIAKLLIGSGLIAGALALVCFYWGLSLGEISRVKPVAFAVAPATAVLLAWLLMGEPMTARKMAGLVLVLAGVALLTGSSGKP